MLICAMHINSTSKMRNVERTSPQSIRCRRIKYKISNVPIDIALSVFLRPNTDSVVEFPSLNCTD